MARRSRVAKSTHSVPDAPPPLLAESGAVGLKQFGGYVREEWHPDLQGSRGMQVYREMSDNDTSIGGALMAIETLLRRVTWTTDPNEAGGSDAVYVSERVNEMRDDMEDQPWTSFVSDALTMLIFGYSPHEEVYKIRRGTEVQAKELRSKHNDGLIAWRRLAPRAQESVLRWEFAKNGDVRGLWQLPPPDYRLRFIPIERLLLFRPITRKNSPEGRSLLRNAYRSYYFCKRMQEIEAIGFERRAAGLPVMQVPPQMLHPNASPAEKAALKDYQDMVQKIRQDSYAGAVIPGEETAEGKTGFKLSLLTSGGENPSDGDVIIKRYETRILMSFLAEFLTLGMDHGTQALSVDKTDMFEMAIEAFLGSFAETVNDVAIPRVCRLNSWGDPRLHPKIQHGEISKPGLKDLGAYLAAVAPYLLPGPKLEEYVRDQGGIPAEDAPATQPMPAQAAPPAPQQQASIY